MLKDTFCSSPWFSMRVEPNGQMHYCRWSTPNNRGPHNIKNTSLQSYFNSDEMKSIRTDMVQGNAITSCQRCYKQDDPDINKISGRARQLCKSAVDLQNFDYSFASSPHYEYWKFSQENAGAANSKLADLQIDLGSWCNSECIMCSPKFSTKLYSTFQKLDWLNPTNPLYQGKFDKPNDWTTDKETLTRFVGEIGELTELRYIHLLGGETLYIPAFYRLCEELIKQGINKHVTLGFTTNGTVWRDDLSDILRQFHTVHLGVSIETTTPLNDYIRYPGKIDVITENILKFKYLSIRNPNIQIQLRPTPSLLSIWHYDELVKFQLKYKLGAESCHILDRPEWLQMSVLPYNLRQMAADKLQYVLDANQLTNIPISNNPNMRNKSLFESVLVQDVTGLMSLLREDYIDNDEIRFKLVRFLHDLEGKRKNSILDYLPEYEEFLRQYGY
jgi:MoaA/NifB/PqqE/SkfB family radical SAM enzyme